MARTFSSAGENKPNRHLASQAAYELASVVADEAPADNAQPEEWAEYVNKARGKAAEAIVTWGQRITQASDAYKSQPQRWGRTWEEWCRENLGISDEYARQLMLIAENIPTTSCGILPPSKNKLFMLAQAESSKSGVVKQAIDDGRIRPDISMREVRSLKAEAEAGTQTVDVQAQVVKSSPTQKPRSIPLPKDLRDALANKGDGWQEWAHKVLREALMRGE